MTDRSAEQQAASHVFDSLTPQQQSELINHAESLLNGNADYTDKIRQRVLSQMASQSSAQVNIDQLTDDILPFAAAKIPDGVRQALIVQLSEMLLLDQQQG